METFHALLSHARHRLSVLVLAVALVAASPVAMSQSVAPSTPEARQQELNEAFKAAFAAAVAAPETVALLDEAKFVVPGGMAFIPAAQAGRVLRAWGNKVSQDPVGMIVGTRQEDNWAVVVRFVREGYIKDDDAKDWKADDMLASIRAGNDESNEDRRARGFPEMEIVGWIVPPAYDAASHRLVSSLAHRQKGAAGPDGEGVNYNTYALGRHGYFSMNLLTSRADVERDKVPAAAAIAAVRFNEGHAYADFNPSTDHTAEYGLAALVGVAAAKKLGFFALIGVFFAKFAKVGAVAVAAGGALLFKFMRRKPRPDPNA